LLGSAFTASIILSVVLIYGHNKLWRAPVFVSSLSLFHFLEFYVTAVANTPDASVSSFLLSSNGPAYTLAHTVAFTECILSHTFYPAIILPTSVHYTLLALGFCFVVVGQIIRTLAMYTAGTNFSHLVAHQKRAQHQLITSGVYHYLRHPSYFGFFWWGIGTQLVCGNSLSLVGFSLVLWYFFWKRIKGEEESLIRFFGKEYEDYRKRTIVGIPFI
jgi:protein-S-isoprenylcysteine O-methyltransferase